MLIINPITYIYLLFLIFFAALFGTFVAKRNLILFLLSMEIIFLSISLVFVIGSYYCDDIVGIIFTIFLLGVVANEIAVGLALLISYTRKQTLGRAYILGFIKS